jgi:hypothetical protein
MQPPHGFLALLKTMGNSTMSVSSCFPCRAAFTVHLVFAFVLWSAPSENPIMFWQPRRYPLCRLISPYNRCNRVNAAACDGRTRSFDKGLRPSVPHSLGHVRASTSATSLRSSIRQSFLPPCFPPRTRLDKSSRHYCKRWLLLCAVTCCHFSVNAAKRGAIILLPCPPWLILQLMLLKQNRQNKKQRQQHKQQFIHRSFAPS